MTLAACATVRGSFLTGGTPRAREPVTPVRVRVMSYQSGTSLPGCGYVGKDGRRCKLYHRHNGTHVLRGKALPPSERKRYTPCGIVEVVGEGWYHCKLPRNHIGLHRGKMSAPQKVASAGPCAVCNGTRTTYNEALGRNIRCSACVGMVSEPAPLDDLPF